MACCIFLAGLCAAVFSGVSWLTRRRRASSTQADAAAWHLPRQEPRA